MPLTSPFTTRAAIKGEGHIHSDKWHRCIEQVKAKGGDVDPYAVCTFSIGYNESVNPEHQTPGPHSSRDTRRFKRRKERQEQAQKANSYAQVLKFNKNHDKEDGRFTTGSSSGGFELRGESETYESGSGGYATTAVSLNHLTPSQQAMQESLARQASKPTYKVKTAEEAVGHILKGDNVEIQDTHDVHTVLKELAEFAIAAKAQGKDAPSFDPCTITVKHVSLFCTEKLKTAEFPHGIPRIEMPQFKSKTPIPGSEADKLPRDFSGEVDASKEFIKHLTDMGVETRPDTVLARKLKASQAEMEGAKVAGMMLSTRDPKTQDIWISKDNYVIDGHHTWAAAIGRDAEDGDLDNDTKMNVIRVNLPMSEVYHVARAWTLAYGLPAAGVKKQDRLSAFMAQLFR